MKNLLIATSIILISTVGKCDIFDFLIAREMIRDEAKREQRNNMLYNSNPETARMILEQERKDKIFAVVITLVGVCVLITMNRNKVKRMFVEG